MSSVKYKITVLLLMVFQIITLGQPIDLIRNFKNPPAEYSLLPFWSWNGTLTAEKLTWQIDQMMDKGIYGAFLHARADLENSETPYFSEGFWNAMDTTIKYSALKGFNAYLYDEDKWPSGSAGGRTLQKNYDEFIKKGLRYQTMEILGPNSINLNESVKNTGIFAARLVGKNEIAQETITDITHLNGKTWKVPEGKWAIVSFTQYNDPSEQIDYLDKKAVEAFIDITHEEYYKRYGKYFGNVIPGVFFDEIYANTKQKNSFVWTDDFLKQFSNLKGYDLRNKLPLLIYSKTKGAEKINNDYYDVFTQLYVNTWFKTYHDWCEEHGIWVTGHTEEGYENYLTQGDYFKTMGQLQVPGTDNEYFRYGFPRIINWIKPKQISSVAHIYGRNRVMAEAMGGGGYIIPLEEYRYGLGMLGAYGINMFVPHLFHYEFDTPATKADWPASWFYRNPYWKYFKPLADFGKRISFMGAQGNHVCDIAMLYPITSKWSDGQEVKYNNKVFDELQGALLKNYRDFDLIDPFSLEQAEIVKNGLKISGEIYKLIILPELTALKNSSSEKLKAFVSQGGIVLAVGRIPSFSPENVEKGSAVAHTMNDIFGIDPNRIYWRIYNMDDDRKQYFNVKEHPFGGKAIFTQYMWEVNDILDKYLEHDIWIKSSTSAGLKFNHRKIDAYDSYMLVNEAREDGNFTISIKNIGIPEIWNPETGEIEEIENYTVANNRLELRLELDAWETCFLVVKPGEINPLKRLIENSSLEISEIVENGETVKITGWGKTNRQHSISWKQGGALQKEIWNAENNLKEILADSVWDFHLTQHELDYNWLPGIEKSEIELPVMEFRWEKTGINTNITTNQELWKWVQIKERFSNLVAAERHVSKWDANWINFSYHTKKLVFPEVWFKKYIILAESPVDAILHIIADQEFELFVNGKKAGVGSGFENVESFNITALLQKGENSIEVHVINCSGLLAQGKFELENGNKIQLITDDNWGASPDRLGYSKAFIVASPPLGKWGNIDRPGVDVELPVRLWYRLILPPGSKYLLKPDIQNDFEIFVNEVKQSSDFSNGRMKLSGLKENGADTLLVTFETNDLKKGIAEPLKVECSKTKLKTGNWEKYGLWWYSGRGIYSNTIDIPAEFISENLKLKLNLGDVAHFAEVWINGQLVKFFPWGAFETDITKFIKEGKNDFSIVVSNLLANKALWNIPDANLHENNSRWWHHGRPIQEPDKLNSGLLGPVKIVPYVRESVEIHIK